MPVAGGVRREVACRDDGGMGPGAAGRGVSIVVRRFIALVFIAGGLVLAGCGVPLTVLVAPVQPVHVGTPKVMPQSLSPDYRTWGAWAFGTF